MVTEKKVEQLLDRITHLKNRVDELENKELRQANQQLRKENKRLRAKLRWYEGPHTPPSKDQSDEDDEQPRTDGGTPGRRSGHDPEWRDAPDPDREIEVTCDCCPDCGEAFDESGADARRPVEELPDPQSPEVIQYSRHHYECHSCGAKLSPHIPTAPMRGSSG